MPEFRRVFHSPRAIREAAIDEPAELLLGLFDPRRIRHDVNVEDDAGKGLLRPREERLGVALDQTDGAVDQIGLLLEEVRADIGEEPYQSVARHVYLRDHLGAALIFAESRAQSLVIVGYVGAHLMLVGPIVLA